MMMTPEIWTREAERNEKDHRVYEKIGFYFFYDGI
jgi:hypothetical protein